MRRSTNASVSSAAIASKPFALAIAAGSPPLAASSASTSLACVAVSSPAVSIRTTVATAAGSTATAASRGTSWTKRASRRAGVDTRVERGEHVGVVVALDEERDVAARRVDAGGACERGPPRGWQRGHRGVDACDPLVTGIERDEVGLGEVAVVLRLLLAPQRVGAALVLVPVPRLLDDALAGLEQLDLAARLVLDGAAERAQRVEVLDLAAGAERCVCGPAAPTRSRRRATSPPPSCASDASMARRMARSSDTYARASVDGAKVGLAHDLEQRHPGAVVVDERVSGVVDPATTSHPWQRGWTCRCPPRDGRG